MPHNLDDFRVEHLPVPANGEAQHDPAVQAAALGDPRITLVAFQFLKNMTEVGLNRPLLLILINIDVGLNGRLLLILINLALGEGTRFPGRRMIIERCLEPI